MISVKTWQPSKCKIYKISHSSVVQSIVVLLCNFFTILHITCMCELFQYSTRSESLVSFDEIKMEIVDFDGSHSSYFCIIHAIKTQREKFNLIRLVERPPLLVSS